MIVTEEKAKELWCPMARPNHNRLPDMGDTYTDQILKCSTCLASRCMWWEWVEKEKTSYPARPRRGQCGAKAR